MYSLEATVEPITKNIHTCIYPTLQNQAKKKKQKRIYVPIYIYDSTIIYANYIYSGIVGHIVYKILNVISER